MKLNCHFLREIFLKRCLYILILVISSSMHSQQPVVTVSGNWTASLPVITEAGNNYTGTYDNSTTSVSAITLSTILSGNFLSLLNSNGAKISMHYTTTAWNSSLGLSARRTGGTGSISGLCLGCTANITGGLTFIPIQQASEATLVNLTFSSLLGLGSTASFSDINFILQVSGVSVTIPAATYSARVVFTVSAN